MAKKESNYKYKFSVVIPVYNVEEYLEETIVSVINQTIGFEENIQMILINDGSPDNSETICLKYKELYPQNIIYKKQKNAGVSAARNRGLKLSQGKYVNFLDSDDKWETYSFEKIYNFFEENYDEIDVIACRIKFFESKKGYHGLDYKFAKKKIVYIKRDYDYIQLHSVSSVFKASAIKNLEFDTNLKYAEDVKFLYQVIFEKEKYGVLPEAVYNYRIRSNESSAMNTTILKETWYLNTILRCHKFLVDYSIEKYGKVILYVQYFLLYDLKSRLFSKPPIGVLTDEDSREYYDNLINLLRQVEDHLILEQKSISLSKKITFLSKKYSRKIHKDFFLKKNSLYFKDNWIVNISKASLVEISILEVKNDEIYLFGKIPNFLNEGEYNFYFKNNKGKTFKPDFFQISNKIEEDYDIENIGFEVKFKINYGDRIAPIIEYKKVPFKSKINFGKFGKLNSDISSFIYESQSYLLKYSNKKIIVINRNKLTLIKNFLLTSKFLIKKKKNSVMLYRIIAKTFKLFKRKEIWIFSDRISTAGDNAEHLFKYCNQEIKNKKKKIKTYYAISKKSNDYNRMKKYGRVIDNGSYLYKILFLNSDNIISSHADEVVTNPFGKNSKYYNDMFLFNYTFLQHGITKDDISSWLNKYNKNIKIFVTSTNDEYNSIITNKYFYDKKVIKLTGMPRYDNLSNNIQKNHKIAIMPTWRQNLSGKMDNETGNRLYNDLFKESEYFKFYDGIINDKKFNDYLESRDIECEFYLHPAFSNQITDFSSDGSVKIVNSPANYQNIFSNYSLLITDYSSVFFDFAYLKKPVIYCQFDKADLFESHLYEKGYFEYERDGFGPVCYNLDDTVEEIIKTINKNFVMEDKYIERVNNTFAYTDRNNCKRVYEEILKLDVNE
jgi:CDP-glycerol glycerophosphotransferase (TagB/SpsB family)/glycosyltransferase involved in cell wall biosynthesis